MQPPQRSHGKVEELSSNPLGRFDSRALDITAAFVNSGLRGVRPIRILQAIASGLLGAGSYKGGFATATLGLVLHFVIAFGATAVYYAASRKLTFLVRAGRCWRFGLRSRSLPVHEFHRVAAFGHCLQTLISAERSRDRLDDPYALRRVADIARGMSVFEVERESRVVLLANLAPRESVILGNMQSLAPSP